MSAARVPFRDRRHGGAILATRLAHLAGRDDVVVLALPRGGVSVGFEVAQALRAPLDIFVVRKLGFPGHEEYAMGAIASGGVRVMNPLPGVSVSADEVAAVVAREQDELQRRERLYRGGQPARALRGKTVVIVDDGLATGSTMRAAVQAVRRQQPARIVVAAPIGAEEARDLLAKEADEVVLAATPRPFRAVGLWYREFPQSTDDEVRTLLEQARREYTAPVP